MRSPNARYSNTQRRIDFVRRFLVSPLPVEGTTAQPSEELAHYLSHVLRLSSGTTVQLFDGEGNACEALWQAGALLGGRRINEPSNVVPIRVACPLLKGDRTDWMIEKLTELMAAAFVPLSCERALIFELSEGKRSRYERIIEAACRQSGRNARMRLEPMADLGALSGGVFLDPRATIPFDEAFRSAAANGADVLVLIGPEGGFSAQEVERLRAKGFVGARLHHTVLRAETAALMAASVAAMCVAS